MSVFSSPVTEPKYEASPRTVRRWVAGVAVLLVVQAGATWVWVVDPGQRVYAVTCALVAACLMAIVCRGIPNSSERRLKPVEKQVKSVEDGLRELPASVAPIMLALLIKGLVPGEPSFWVETGVLGSAATGVVALSVLLRHHLRRRGRRRGLSAR